MLDARRVRRHATQPLTYREVGGTAGELPDGYRILRMSRGLGRGADLFEAASRRLMTWQVHQASGLRVRASCDTVGVGGVVELRLGRWPIVNGQRDFPVGGQLISLSADT